MKKLILIPVIIAVILGGWVARSLYQAHSAPRLANLQSSVEVTRGNLESLVTAQGKLEPKDYVDVGAQVSGSVVKMHVEISDTVKTGDLIAEIDPDIYEARVKASEARLSQLQAQKSQQDALIKQAEWKYERNKKLYADRAVSKEALEDSEISFDIAKASLRAIEAQIEEAGSSLEGDKANLNYTKIFSPMDGTVVAQEVKEGQTINANQTTPTIVQVANLDMMTAKAQVAEADVMKLQDGMPVYFTTLGSGERRWEGTIRQILPTPETINNVVLYNVLVDVANKDLLLLPGMTTQMFFIVAQAENAPIIPANVLGRRVRDRDTKEGLAYEVLVLNARGGTETRVVIVSLSDRAKAAIADGLEAGERVVPAQASSANGGSSASRMRMPRL